MSEKMTRLRLPGSTDFVGLMEWGECTSEQMISMARDYAKSLRCEAEVIEEAADEDFQIDLVRGVHVQHHVKNLQQSSRISSGKQQRR